MNLDYQTNIPNRPNKPTNDQPQMTINANSINSWVNIDHVGFNTNDSTGGYHQQVHMVTNQASPGKNTGIGVLYANTGTAVSQLFYDNGTTNYQIWSGQSSAAAAPGYIKVGNIMFQWGSSAINGMQNLPITFTPNFSNIPYSVVANLGIAAASTPTNGVYVSSATSSGANIYNGTGIVTVVNWIAIGPIT